MEFVVLLVLGERVAGDEVHQHPDQEVQVVLDVGILVGIGRTEDVEQDLFLLHPVEQDLAVLFQQVAHQEGDDVVDAPVLSDVAQD